MVQDIRTINDMESLITYFSETLGWDIDPDDFYDIDDITYEFDAADLGLKEEAFAKITSLKQMRPLVDNQKWGIFFVEFDSARFEVSALRKILSGLIPTRRNSAEHAVWDKNDLLFICTWGKRNRVTIGAAHFEDSEKGLPQIKMFSCNPAVEDFTQLQLFEERLSKLHWPSDTSNLEKWQESWASAFTTRYRQTIKDAQTLTVQLAKEAKYIKDSILNILDIETSNGYVHLLYDKFRNTLIHDMSEQDFADMYAQTVVYGLFSARCMDNTQEDFSAIEAIDCIPNTNPFLKRLMAECFGTNGIGGKLSFDELEIGRIVELLVNTRTDSIIADFNRQTGGGKEDPVIHFYEEFLKEYDKTQKVQRGVFYTPQPVVSFIVRSIDDLLRDEFGYTDGLATTKTKTIKIKRKSKKKVKGRYTLVDDDKTVPAVQILDPATGTGTFLRQVILQIFESYKNSHSLLTENELSIKWSEYVDNSLLNRLFGFELMMAPYAVAHMKLAMVLKDTGYNFSSNNRLKVYLTNALEKAGNSDTQMTFFEDPLAIESIESNIAKKNSGINIVLGNPPYSGESANIGEWAQSLVDEYKKEPGGKEKLNERNPKYLNDDYVKFLRFAQLYAARNSEGIVGYICPHGFVDNPTFRGMRWNLANSFDSIRILDLHGNAKKQETAPDGGKDENVFDIQQGVCIVLLVKNSKAKQKGVYYANLFGTRALKYEQLSNLNLSDIDWGKANCEAPFYVFKPMTKAKVSDKGLFSVQDLFKISAMGFMSHRDSFAVANTKQEIEERINLLCDTSITNDMLRTKFNLKDSSDWNLDNTRKQFMSMRSSERYESITPCSYRMFDNKWCCLDRLVMDRPRINVFEHVVNRDNYVFGVGRQGLAVGDIEWCLAAISKYAMDGNYFRRGGVISSPLYLYHSDFNGVYRIPNLNEEIVDRIAKCTNLSYDTESNENIDGFCPIDVMDYVYAVLYSHKYRESFCDELKIDYPKIPYPSNKKYFKDMASFGKELREIHTMECNLDCDHVLFSGNSTQIVESFKLKDNKVFINKQQYFEVKDYDLAVAWEYSIGGNQPLQKWLKDRKNTILSDDDIKHYKVIVASIIKTIDLMESIDQIICL